MPAVSMPPGTATGKAFIHDLQLSNQAEKKAFIKLKFQKSEGIDVFALHSFQLTNHQTK